MKINIYQDAETVRTLPVRMAMRAGERVIYSGDAHVVVCDGRTHTQIWEDGSRHYDSEHPWEGEPA